MHPSLQRDELLSLLSQNETPDQTSHRAEHAIDTDGDTSVAKKADKHEDHEPTRALGVGATGDIDNPAAGADAFGTVAEVQELEAAKRQADTEADAGTETGTKKAKEKD
jgi:hypothetical protein